MVHAGLGKKQNYISKIPRAKRAGGIAQKVEHLCYKCKVLKSNPRTAKKIKKKKILLVVKKKNLCSSNVALN
jgi:hypothetical protein